ncbi:alpha/beta hydrolase [Alcaligenes endophyticus]|uniref:Alpha/beta hydrolase n=1 Tax=Alcaligenes endophyticus TaxID=1929088 RepID=A0ABT8ELL2_9BURK|nr:alpha/beta hydrolase-fold protein [Alcaligenes endophyticus]MCX5591253.1 alpha/beta hydrolase-fold protein [Alcaligenes endophyticus]MDN4122169.1 alpha/beta hydrolase [Alcaligenes endophyticus]
MQQAHFFINGPQGREYRVSLAWPSMSAPAQGWPAALVLDTPQFERLVGHTLALEPDWPAALIGVGYVDTVEREADYPPCDAVGRAGGAAHFLAFLQQLVLPAVQARLAVDHRQLCLFGHSLAGLFALYAATHSRRVFQAFVVSSPSVWWAQGQAVQACLRAIVSAPPAEPKRQLLISVGEYEQSLSPQEQELELTERQRRYQRRSERRMVDGARELAQRLQRHADFQVSFRLIQACGHGEAAIQAFVQGWRFILNRSDL